MQEEKQNDSIAGRHKLWGSKSAAEAKMSEELIAESNRLRAAWMRHDSKMLDEYLIKNVEDPRINPQSIISRAFLVDAIWPDEFTALIREEFRFSICMNFILKILKTAPQVGRAEILNALIEGKKGCDGFEFPSYLVTCFDIISGEQQDIPDYISEACISSRRDAKGLLPESALSTFELIWRRILSQREAKRISVLEPACGSANDYRYLDYYGISRFLEYTGFDICDKNIINSRQRFREAHFEIGNAMDIPVDDDSYDYLFVHDLFEHLSVEAMNIALAEISRVTRKQACLSFFNIDDIDEHIIKFDGFYHNNTLSLNKVREVLMDFACDIDVIHIDDFLRQNYDCDDYHNKKAYTFIATFDK